MNDFAPLDTPGGPVGVKEEEFNQNQLIRSLCYVIVTVVTLQKLYQYLPRYVKGRSMVKLYICNSLVEDLTNSESCHIVL